MTTITVVLTGIAGLSVTMGVLVWRKRGAPAATPVLVMAGACFVWILSYLLEIRAGSEAMMVFAARMQYTVIPLVPTSVLWFGILYAGRRPRRFREAVFASAVIPALTGLLAWTNGYHGLVWSGTGVVQGDGWSVLAPEYGLLFWIHAAYSYSCLIAALVLVGSVALRSAGVRRRQASLVIIGMVAPWIANLLRISGLSPIDPIDPTPFAFVATTVAFGVAATSLRLFSLAPVARDLVVETIEDGIVVLDEMGRVADLNGAASRILNVPVDYALGRVGRDILGDLSSALDQGEGRRTVHVSRGTGEAVFECSVIPMAESEDPTQPVVLLLRDVTVVAEAHARLEDTRTHLERELRKAQRVEGIGTFMGGIAHDLNNLLTAILGFAELAVSSAENDPQLREDLGQISTAGKHAKNLVAQILKLGRKSKSAREAVNLTESVQDAVALLRAVVPRSIAVETTIASNVPPVWADATQLQQVLMNLCVNAAHAMPDGGRLGISIDASSDGWPGSMGVPTELVAGGRVHLVVSDTGCGMEPETSARIFDPFFSTKGDGQGTGLGLSVVKNIIDEHGGEISVRSAPGVGTTFTIRLPVVERAEPSAV